MEKIQSDVPYDPDAYWEARGGESYQVYVESANYAVYRRAQEHFFRDLLTRLQPATLLDFGCGTGKLFELWRQVPEVHGYDRSRSQLEVARVEAKRVCPERPYHLLHYASADRSGLPYDDDYFDLVVTAEVLLHVLPSDMPLLLSELYRVCRGSVAIVTAAPFDRPASHNFDHDYSALLQPQFEIADDHVQHEQRYLVVRKRALTVTRTEKEEMHAILPA